MVPPDDKQKDAGQFNAWLTNLAPKAPPRPAAPGQAPAAPRPPAGSSAGPRGGGLLGAGLDDELDDIFGKIVTDDAPAAPPPQAPPMPKPAAPLPPAPPQQTATRPAALPAFNVPATPPRPPAQPPQPAFSPPAVPVFAEAPRPPAPARPVPVAPPPAPTPAGPPVQPSVQASSPSVAQPSFKQIEAAVNEVRQEMQDRIEQLELKHQSELQGAVAKARSEFQPQLQQMQVQRQNDIQNAMAQGRVEVQSKIQEIQLKYQDQRQKWEKVLGDLRIRNEELTARNHELEEQLAQLRERQRMLIQEYAGAAAPPPIPPVETPRGPEIVFPGGPPAVPEIALEMPLSRPEMALPEPTGQDQAMMARNESTLSEADDLLAELDALENEMRNLGGNS